MVTRLLLFTLVTSICLNAQTFLPRAGQVLPKGISKAEITRMMMPVKPVNKETLDIINFDSSNANFMGNLPFSLSYAMAVSDSGNIAFVCSGGGIYVTDVSNPSSPTVLSEIRTRSLVDGCTYDSKTKRLYVNAYFSGIEIWNLADLHNPTRMSRLATEPYPRSGCGIVGDYLIVTTNSDIMSVDVKDPYKPVVKNTINLGSGLIMQMKVVGGIAYIISDTQGLKLINVSDPLNLSLISSPGYMAAHKFFIKGSYLYGVNFNGNFTILNIADSMNVTYVGSLNINGYCERVVVFGENAFVSKFGDNGGIQVIDVSNPAAPAAGTLFPGDYQFISGVKDYIYATRNSTFSVLNVTNPTSIQRVAGFDIPGYIMDVAYKDGYAYTGSNGFRVISMADTARPEQVGYSPAIGDMVTKTDTSLMFYSPWSMTANNLVHLMNISDPAHPVVKDSIMFPVMSMDVAIKDKMAFFGCWWDGIRVVDFSNPSDIKFVKHFFNWHQGAIPGTDYCYVQGIAIEGDLLYVISYGPFPDTEDDKGLYIFDITDVQNPVLVKRFKDLTSHAIDIKVRDQKAYIADGFGGIEVVDCSNPNNPVELANLRLVDGATGISLDNNFAYLSDYILGGIQIVDITTPASPVLAAYYKPSGCFAIGVQANNGIAYVADGLAGFQTYRNWLNPISDVKDENIIVKDYKLGNYPNPFNPTTNIVYQIPVSGMVTLKVFDILGREVATLTNEVKSAGRYEVKLNAASLPSGVYFYQLRSSDFVQTKKMNLIK